MRRRHSGIRKCNQDSRGDLVPGNAADGSLSPEEGLGWELDTLTSDYRALVLDSGCLARLHPDSVHQDVLC